MNNIGIKGIRQKDILFLSISFFVVVVAWIGFNLYHVWATSTIPEDVQSQMTPIEGTFDTNTLRELKIREPVTPLYELSGESSSQAAVTATPSPTEIPEEATEEATDEAELTGT